VVERDAFARRLGGRNDSIRLVQTGDERFFADDVSAGSEAFQSVAGVRIRGGTYDDDIGARAIEHRVEVTEGRDIPRLRSAVPVSRVDVAGADDRHPRHPGKRGEMKRMPGVPETHDRNTSRRIH